MDYSTQQLQQIHEYAAALTPITDIAVLMDIDPNELHDDISCMESEVSRAYHKGKAETALRLRQNELQLADAGSPLAVQLVSSYLQDMYNDEDL